MMIGEIVDCVVQCDAYLNFLGVVPPFGFFNSIGYKVANGNLIVVKRQVNVGEKIQLQKGIKKPGEGRVLDELVQV